MIARGYVVVTNVNDGAKGDKGDKGDRGLPGAGVKSTIVEYARGLSPTDPPGKYLVDVSGNPLADESGNILVDSRWTSAIPQIPDGFYLWSRTTTIYDDDSESVTYSVGYNGASIATERRQYYLSTSNSRLVGGSWQYTEPDASDGTFIWERFEFMLTDGTIRYSDAVYSKTLHGIINKTDELEQKIVQKVWETDIDTKISSYDGETVQTVRDRVNNTEIDLSGIWTAISDDETKTVTKADGTVVTTLASRVHDIKDTADEHTRTISQDILGDSTTSLKTVANQAANHFTWLVKSGTSSSNMTLTNDALRIIARDIDLTGKVTFNSFDTSTKKRITDVEDEVESINIGDIVTTYGVSNGPTVQPSTWSSTVPTFQEGKYIWQKTVKTSRTGTDTTTIVCLTGHKGATGENGAAGLNTASVFLYQRATSAPAKPSSSLTYTFATGALSGTLGNWSQSIPSGSNPIYVTVATASANTDTDTIAASEWSNPILFVQNGGTGASGYNQATIFLYQRAATTPSLPSSAVTYTFSTGALNSVPTGWSRTVPTNDGNPCWVTTATAISQSSSVSVPASAWASVQKLAENGNGIKSTTISYAVSESGTEIPCKPLADSDGKLLKDESGNYLSNGVWTSTIRDTIDGDYVWSRTEIEYDDGTKSVTYSAARNGVGIESSVPYYYLSSSKPSTTPLSSNNSGWATAPQDYVIGMKYWKCELITYKDGTQKVTEVVEEKGLNSANERALLAYNTSVTASDILAAWTEDATLSTTTINGGFIKTHTIQAEQLATDAIMSTNYARTSSNGQYSGTGSYFDLENGNIISPYFSVINTAPAGSGLTTGAYFNGAVTATSLTLGGDVKVSTNNISGLTAIAKNNTVGTVSDGNTGIQISDAGLLKAYNAEISGNIKAKTGDIGGWNITTDKLWYGNQTHGAATEAFILTPKGETVNATIGGASGSNKWAMSIGKSFGVTTNGYMYTNSGKIGGWTIGNGTNGHNGIYNGTDTISSTTAGTYVGTDGIRNYNSATSYVLISGGKITAKAADISGTITATSGSFTGSIKASDGYIGSSDSDSSRIVLDGTKHAIYYNISDFSTSNTNPGFYIGSAGIVIGKGFYVDSSGNTNIKLSGTKTPSGSSTTVSYSFNLDGDGYLSASNASVDGNIVAKTGNIGPWVINQTSISKQSSGNNAGTYGTENHMYFGDNGLSISNKFKVSSAGALTSTSGQIGPWYIEATSISKNSDGSAAGTHDTTDCMYFGNSGLSISKAFVVDNTGILTAEDANIRGEITAKEYKMYKKSGDKEIETSVIKAQVLDIGGKSKEIIYGNNSNTETGKSYLTLRYGTDTGDGYALLTSTQYITLNSPTVNLMADSINLNTDGQICIGSTTASNDAIKLRDVSVINNATSEGDNSFTRLDISGGIKTDNTIYTFGNYRIRYKTEKSNGTLNSSNETVACIENIKPPSSLLNSQDVSSVNIGSGNNETCIKFGGTVGNSTSFGPCIVMKPTGGNMYVQLSHNSSPKWYDLHSCLEKALNASDSGSGTSYSFNSNEFNVSNNNTVSLKYSYLTSGDLSGYATQSWVTNKEYATQSWVTNKEYATQSWVNNKGYATQSWVNNKGYSSVVYTNGTGSNSGEFTGVQSGVLYLACFHFDSSPNSTALYMFIGGKTTYQPIKSGSDIGITLTSSKFSWTDSAKSVRVRILSLG